MGFPTGPAVTLPFHNDGKRDPDSRQNHSDADFERFFHRSTSNPWNRRRNCAPKSLRTSVVRGLFLCNFAPHAPPHFSEAAPRSFLTDWPALPPRIPTARFAWLALPLARFPVVGPRSPALASRTACPCPAACIRRIVTLSAESAAVSVNSLFTAAFSGLTGPGCSPIRFFNEPPVAPCFFASVRKGQVSGRLGLDRLPFDF